MRRLIMQTYVSAYTIALVLASITSHVTPGWAQLASPVSSIANRLPAPYAQLKLPDNGAPTGRSRGAASRSLCGSESPLTALVPTTEKRLNQGKVTYVWGKTIAEHPTFWFYVPYSPTVLRTLEFVLQDERDNDVYRTLFTLPTAPGIVSVRLPSTSAPLQTNKMYHWYFKASAKCNSQPQSIVKDYVEGWIQRVAPIPVTGQPAIMTSPQQVMPYANNGIWYDILTSLAQLRLADPTNAALMTDWTNLLQSAGLEDMVSKPIIQCCTPKNPSSAGTSN